MLKLHASADMHDLKTLGNIIRPLLEVAGDKLPSLGEDDFQRRKNGVEIAYKVVPFQQVSFDLSLDIPKVIAAVETEAEIDIASIVEDLVQIAVIYKNMAEKAKSEHARKSGITKKGVAEAFA